MLIEQAVFTSARTDRARGYHLVAGSPGIRVEDARQLSAWAPAHGSLCGTELDAQSVNFHPLASGAVCVSRSAAAGAEYSGRSGPRVYTQFFVVPAEVSRAIRQQSAGISAGGERAWRAEVVRSRAADSAGVRFAGPDGGRR